MKQPNDSAALVPAVEDGLATAVGESKWYNIGDDITQPGPVAPEILAGIDAFRKLVARMQAVERENERLRAFVESVANNKPGSGTMHIVNAFLKVRNDARELLASLTEIKTAPTNHDG